MVWAMELPETKLPNPTDNHVLLVLSNYADANGESAWPSNATLQKTTKLDRRTIQRSLQRLKKAGLIIQASKHILPERIRADKRPNVYRLNMTKP